MDERAVSPPPPKRRRLSDSTGRSSYQDATSRNAITIFSFNINGISPFLQARVNAYFKPTVKSRSELGNARASLRDFLRRHNWPTFLFLQEVKINPGDSATTRAIKNAVKRQPSEPDDAYEYEAHFCLPSDKFNARGFGRKVYGVCSIVRKDFSEQYVDKIRPVDWDAEGRFLVIETKPEASVPKLAIFNIYLVNGTDHPYKDPETGQVTGIRHDRKLAVHSLLQEECRTLENDGFGVIIAGDMNIARTPMDGHPNLRTFPKQHCLNRADFEAKFFSAPTDEHTDSGGGDGSTAKKADSGLAMLDTFRYLYPERKCYTFYPRRKTFGESCDRVDMVLISKSLGGQLKEAGMHETPSERGPSDHVPLYAYLDFEESASKRSRKV
jgi:exonuclease III